MSDYVFYESSPRLGGVLRTENIDGCIVEAGPDSFITEKPWATDLCRALGLGDQLIGSNDADRKTYILTTGTPRRNARRPDVHGPDKNSANWHVATLFVEDQAAHGARTLPSAAQPSIMTSPSPPSSSATTGPRWSTASPTRSLRRLRRRSRQPQRSRGPSAIRRNGA